MEKRGINELLLGHGPSLEPLAATMEAFETALDGLPDNKRLRDV